MWNLVSGKGWMKNSETSCWLLASLALSSLRKSRNEDCPNGFSIAYSFKYRSIFKYRKLSFSFEVLNQYSCSPSMKDWFWSLMRRIKFELIMQSVVLLRWSSRRDLPAAHSQVLPTDLLRLTNISSTLNTLAGKLSACCTESGSPNWPAWLAWRKCGSVAAPERARESQSKPESGKESQWKPEWELQKAINSQ